MLRTNYYYVGALILCNLLVLWNVAALSGAAVLAPILSATENALLVKHFDNIRVEGKFIHMVEFGGGSETASLSSHDSIVSWSVISHDKDVATHLADQFDGSKRVTVKHISGTNSAATSDRSVDEGSFSDYDAYISEIVYFGAKDKAAYWVANFGKARVDVGIASLPLLVRTGGIMAIAGWSIHDCYVETLLQFFEVVDQVDTLAILKPKDTAELQQILTTGVQYNWCFSFGNGASLVKQANAPSVTADVVAMMQQNTEIGCADLGRGMFHCPHDVGDASTACISCYDVLMAISNRGARLTHSLKQVAGLETTMSEL